MEKFYNLKAGQEDNPVLFKEEQNFLLALPIISILMIFLNLLFLYAIWHQIFRRQPFGDNPMSDTGLVLLFAFTFGITLLLWFMRLQTEIRTDGIYARFYPFHIKYSHFKPENMEKCYLRKYQPIREFGGWGWRYSIRSGGKAWNVSGNTGLQLEFKNGKKLLLGTRKPKTVAVALKQTSWFQKLNPGEH